MIVSPIGTEELGEFSGVLIDAARWLEQTGQPLWSPEHLTPEALLRTYGLQEMRLGRVAGEVVAAMILQGSDPLFWPEAPEGEALYVHKLAVRREWAGRGLARLMLEHAVSEAQAAARPFLRLDTVADRMRLRALYEDFGFVVVDERRVLERMVTRYELKVLPPARTAVPSRLEHE